MISCTDLRCERAVDPIGLDARAPRLTWRLVATGGETGVVQTACRVEVEGRWDSERIDTWRQQVIYRGPPFASRERLRWRVRAATSAGDTGWSEWARFETGILDPAEWDATMITADVATPVVRFSRSFEVPGDLRAARLRVTAHGVVTMTINGVDAYDDVLAPGWTSYHRRLALRTYDVTSLCAPGQAEIAALVAPGWFSGRIGFDARRRVYGDHRGLFAQLELDDAAGARCVVATDRSWHASATRFRLADIYDGETYDGRPLTPGAPVPARELEGFDPAVLFAPAVPPVRRTAAVRPVSVDGDIWDFGQNLVGRLRITVRGAPAGTTVVMRHAEMLGPGGRLNTVPLRTAAATDTYITGGAAEEVYEPSFTFHGFRYAEITGVDPGCVSAVALVVHSDLERTGELSLSDPLLERLHANVVWSMRGNFVSLPTDCPQRDERLGWTGDAQVFSPTASFLYDCETFWEGWLADLAADQLPSGSVPHVVPSAPLMRSGPAGGDEPAGASGTHGAAGWGDAAVVVPWTTYVAYGDEAVLAASFASMRRWVDYALGRLDGELRWVQDRQFGDWLDPDAPANKPARAKARFDLVATAYAAMSAALVARAARVLGDAQSAASYGERAEALRDAWWTHYGAAAATTQTGAAIAIRFGLAPDEHARTELGDALVRLVAEADDHLATGFLGTPLLTPALCDTGHADVAYRVLMQRTRPSWLAQVLAGATTIWERWDALGPDGTVPLDVLAAGFGWPMVSLNHYAYGAVASWLHAAVAGLAPDPDDPGYHHVLIEPHPGGGLERTAASLLTRYGRVALSWRVEDATTLHVDVELPPNTSATVTLPGAAPVQVGSGAHAFAAPMPARPAGT